LIAGIARLVRDVARAEDPAQEALVAALEQWPESGVPENPGAWLMATAKHRGVDRLRRAESTGVRPRSSPATRNCARPLMRRTLRPRRMTRSTMTFCARAGGPRARRADRAAAIPHAGADLACG
jgi:predicted RNA polymerase sigma factor